MQPSRYPVPLVLSLLVSSAGCDARADRKPKQANREVAAPASTACPDDETPGLLHEAVYRLERGDAPEEPLDLAAQARDRALRGGRGQRIVLALHDGLVAAAKKQPIPMRGHPHEH